VGLLSVVGADEAGRRLAQLMAGEDVATSLHEDAGLSTTIKLRVIARQQQMLRVDFENQPTHEVLRQKLAEYEKRLDECDVVVLSDYGKGGLTHIGEMLRLAREAGRPVLVDPKGDDYARYAGATLLTPNRAELREVMGRWSDDEDLQRRATALRDTLNIEALLLTRSEEGMTLFSRDGMVHEPAQAREVFDVSGAGDTVIATLAVMLGSGLPLAQAMRLANRAAGIVVGKLGTAVCGRDELEDDLRQRPLMP
jgi:rfaE bifunctional protein kinase chain/domain